MKLAAGTRLGPYEVVAPLGAGGMGEVYRARDTRLDRTVALKILAPELGADEAFTVRFEREARTIASLNHPHICTLHDVGHQDGVSYLILELIEGQTVEERLRAQGQGLKVDEALGIAIDIADALDAAHRHGIVHRDLKPGNVMLTPSGAKLMDFGLAKHAGGTAAAALSMLATQPGTGTAQGTIVGTLQYMAPEQIQGHEADARTDIFALGQVIYEMVTGRKAFEGQTQASVIAKILETDPPPMSATVRLSPPGLDRVVQRCLAKEPNDRWQSARDVLLELRWVRQEGAKAAVPAAPVSRGLRWLPWAIALTALGAVGAAWMARPVPSAPDRLVLRFDVALPRDMAFEDWRGWPVLSPDGRVLVLPVAHDGRSLLAMRRLDEPSFTPLAGTEGARSPFFSPSGRSIGFVVGGKLKRIEITGGPAVVVTDRAAFGARGGAWNRAGTLLFAAADSPVLSSTSESGGPPQPATTLDTSRGDTVHLFPEFLPDGRSFLFTVRGREPGIYVGTLGSSTTKRLLAESSRGHYVEPGYVVFGRGNAVLAVPFDARRLEVTGPAFPIADRVFPAQYFTTSGGHLAYRFDGGDATQLAWYRRDGTRLETVGSPGPFRQIALSPTGRRVAIQRGDAVERGADADIWLMDLATGVLSRLTRDPGLDTDPSWSPDERRIAFMSNRTGQGAIFVKDLGTGLESQLFDSPVSLVLDEWTPDGRFIVFRSGGQAISVQPAAGPGTPRRLVDTPGLINDQAHVSPDGRWIAFNSDESGRWEVYLASFPEFTGKRQVSTSGGMQPVWRRDGRELYYLSPQGQLMAIDVRAGDSIETGAPRPLFQTPLADPSVQLGEYGIAPDGQRFLFLEPAGGHVKAITLLFNWPARPR